MTTNPKMATGVALWHVYYIIGVLCIIQSTYPLYRPFDPFSSKTEPQPPPQPTSQTEANVGAGSEGIQSGSVYPQQLPMPVSSPDPPSPPPPQTWGRPQRNTTMF